MHSQSYNSFAHSIINTLESLEISYAIGGSFASSFYGEPRPTVDIDISLVLPFSEAPRFVQAIEKFGYYIYLEGILDALVEHTPFNIIDADSGYKADMFLVENSPLEQSIFERRRRVVYNVETNAEAWLYSPEDTIIYKLKYYLEGQMPKHPRDILAMLILRSQEMDYEYIAYWVQQIGAEQVWNDMLEQYRRLADGK